MEPRLGRVPAHTARGEPHVARQHGPTAPAGPRTAGRHHRIASKACINRALSRQEEIFRAPRRAKRRAPVRESPTDRPAKTGNLSRTPKRCACFRHSRAARFKCPPAGRGYRAQSVQVGPHTRLAPRAPPKSRCSWAAPTARDNPVHAGPPHPQPTNGPYSPSHRTHNTRRSRPPRSQRRCDHKRELPLMREPA